MKIGAFIPVSIFVGAFLQSQAEAPLSLAFAEAGVSQVREGSTSKVPLIVNPSLASISVRLQAVHSLSDELSVDEIKELSAFLVALPNAGETNAAGLHVLKNNILNVLRNQASPPAELTDVLLAIFENERQDSVTRDYAVQHLTSWYQRPGGGHDLSTRNRIRNALQQAVMEKGSISGTALLGLHRLSRMDASFPQQEIDKRAIDLAENSHTDPAARITAILVCGERELREVLPLIRTLATAQDDIALQVSAIGALGRIGTISDIDQLRQFESRTSEPVQVSIRAAVNQLSQKHKIF